MELKRELTINHSNIQALKHSSTQTIMTRDIFKSITFSLFLALFATASAQQTKRVLFVGNSYIYTNNLPGMIADMAASMGDELQHTSNTPGGCTFQQHCTNQSMALIQQGGWDAVILQEQSQLPSFPMSQVEDEVFPYATQLVNAVYAASPCAEPMFYMTWGRRDGDQQNAQYFSVLGSYEGMDSMLCLRYTQMAADNDASLCPVGRVWRLLRTENPEIELYAADGSHPSLAGTYAAACAFYAMLFHRDPAELQYDASLNRDIATTIRLAASRIVWSSDQPDPQWLRPSPTASFDTSIVNSQLSIVNFSTHSDSLFWNFGDGTTLPTSADTDTITHSYSDTGNYTVTLVASRHCMTDTATIDIHIGSLAPDTTATDTTTDPDDPVGITQAFKHSDIHQFTVFPTVTTGIVTISSPTPSAIDVTIITTTGQEIMRKRLQAPAQLDLTPLPKGLHLIRLVQEDTSETLKVILQ